MEKKNIFIAGAWPYANYLMHLGHLVALLPGTILSDFFKQKGDNVIYVSGSDCHGTPITVRAKKEGITPEQIASKYHAEFVRIFADMGFSYDLYAATSDEYHKQRVQEFIKKIYDNGYIYEKTEDEDYCEKCDKYLADRDIEGTCSLCGGQAKGDQCDACLSSLTPDQIKNKKCITCGAAPSKRKNKHLYFKLSAFESQIRALLEKNRKFWRPNAVRETEKFLKQGLIDRAVTRQINWGIDIPSEIAGFADKKVYVWFEAVLGYITAGERVAASHGLSLIEFLQSAVNYYIHGKDNIPFHTIILPALLIAINPAYALPEYIVSSEFMNFGASKMSKSSGNLTLVRDLLNVSCADTLRYYFCFNNPENKDASFLISDYVAIHNKHLCGGLGNFANRNLSFLMKKFEGNVPNGTVEPEVKAEVAAAYKEIEELFTSARVREATVRMFDLIQFANKYYDSRKPWESVKLPDQTEFNNTTASCLYLIANFANIMNPVVPEAAAKIRKMLELPAPAWAEVNPKNNLTLKEVEILYNRIDEKIIEEF